MLCASGLKSYAWTHSTRSLSWTANQSDLSRGMPNSSLTLWGFGALEKFWHAFTFVFLFFIFFCFLETYEWLMFDDNDFIFSDGN